MNPPLQAWTYVVGWTLIHFVWQGALLPLPSPRVCACAGDARRRRGTRSRASA